VTWEVVHGDCMDVMRGIECADAIVTDPPYGLEFMGKDWDHGIPGVPFWEAALRAANPGAHLLAFGGTRTHHRLMCAIEDAGWEIRDCLMWVYGSGFPKSLDVSKAIDKAAGAERQKQKIGKAVKRMIPGADQNNTGSWIKDNGREYQPGREMPATDAAKQWDGWGTALKPAYEIIILARKPLTGTVAANVQEHGTGGLNIDGCRVGNELLPEQRAGEARLGAFERQDMVTPERYGRWPANVIHDGSEEVMGAFPATNSTRVNNPNEPKRSGGWTGDGIGHDHRDFGSAARFFYCAKASRSERGEDNGHPTVKPIALMRWLCRLVTPSGGLILDPFCGSGSTGVAAVFEGFRFVGIDDKPDYCEIARKRIAAANEQTIMELEA